MYHQIELAIIPMLSLGDTIKHWNSIGSSLAEHDRKRTMQLDKAFLGETS